jgi:tetratricopeptide (TPR) repeat protein
MTSRISHLTRCSVGRARLEEPQSLGRDNHVAHGYATIVAGAALAGPCYLQPMSHSVLSQRILIDITIRAREPGEEEFETVQWQMPTTLLQAFQREARRRDTDLHSLLRDIAGSALTERAEAIRQRRQEAPHERVPLHVVSAEPERAPTATPITFPVPVSDVQLDAQEFIYRAWEAPTRAEERRLAQQALALWPDCADAYNVFARHARSLKEQRRQYELGLAAGERALGPAVFDQERGHFWLLLETRPYMRARQGLAYTLWQLGERQAAIAHLWAMLELNPMDNQGLRYLLANWLLAEDDAAGLDRLLALYPDEWSATLAYTAALHRFRQDGASRPAAKALRYALKVNTFVPAYLLDEKSVPKTLPDYVGMGDEREAQAYAAEAKALWQATPGASVRLLASVRKRAPQRER